MVLNMLLRPSETFLERTKDAREVRGMSQRQLVARLEAEHGIHLTQPAYTLLESGRRALKFDEAVAISRVLNVSLELMYAPSWHDYLVMESEAGK